MNKKLLIILISAFLLRLISLNQSLWLDEGTTAKVMIHFSAIDYLTKFAPFDFHPPLYYLFMKLWTNIFGYSEVALRMPSVLFSLLTGYIVYRITKLLNCYIVGIWGAVLFLFNPLIVFYSQEARMYMMATFILTLSLYYVLQIVIARKPLWRLTKQSTLMRLPRSLWSLAMTYSITLLFGLFISLSFATFYGSIFLIIPMLLLLLYKKKYKEFFISSLILTSCFLILTPLLLQQFSNSRESLLTVTNWKSVLGTANLKNLLMIPLKFAFGRISFYPKWLYYLISCSWTIVVWLFVIKNSIQKKTKSIFNIQYYLLFLLVSPIAIGLLFSFSSPLLQYFRFIYLIPIMCILLAFGLSGKAGFHLRGVTLASGFIILSLIYLLLPQFHREDWGRLSSRLSPVFPVYMIKSSSDGLTYYRPDIKIKELRNVSPVGRKLYIIPYTSDIYGYDYQNDLTKYGYSKKYIQSFNKLSYEIWEKQ